MGNTAIVEMKGITKRFPGVLALNKVDFNIHKGEIVALLGENGAGKTTLMNILYGLYVPDEGEILVDGVRAHISSPTDAIKLGINMVHQQFMLIEEFTALENIVLGSKLVGATLNYRIAVEEIKKLTHELGFNIPLTKKVKELSAGEKQRVEIVKALVRRARVLILDEPTSVLTPQEVRELFKLLRRLKQAGVSVVFISHKLNEVMDIADRIVVLRRGRKVGEVDGASANPILLAEMMVGKEVLFSLKKPDVGPREEVLTIRDLTVLSDEGLPAVKNVFLRVRKGEIVGLAGVAGNGQKELAEAIYGLRKPVSGQILLNGTDVTNIPIKERLKLGLSYIPQNRLIYGVAGYMSLAENILIDRVEENKFAKSGKFLLRLINIGQVLRYSEELIKKYEIVAPGPQVKARTLSGGNLQRLILARELERSPNLIIAEEPTAGLDVKATEYVRQTLLDIKARGVGVLLVSGDLTEIFQLSDKIAVMHGGEIVGVFKAGEVSEEIGLYMMGIERMGREEVMRKWESC